MLGRLLDKEITDYNDLLHTYQYINGEYEIVDTAKAPIDGFRNWLIDPTADPQQDLPLFKPQYTWVDETVNILKQEDISKDLSNFLNRKINLPIRNNTSRYSTSDYYDKHSSDMVYNRYKEDFKKFNYKRL